MRWTARGCVLFAVAGWVAGCSDNGSNVSAPSGPPQISGSYTLNQSSLTGSLNGVTGSCSAGGTSMTLTQTDTVFTGTYSGGTFTCTGNGKTASATIGAGAVLNGSVDAAGHVQFDLDTPDYRLTGTVNGNSMSGTVTIHLTVSGSPFDLTGDWTADRTSTSTRAGALPLQAHGRTAIEALSALVR